MENQLPRSFLSALYAVAALLLIAPALDLLGLTWPVRTTEPGWRFGSLGLGFEKSIIQIIGLSIAMATAAFLGHRRLLRGFSSLALVSAFLVVAGMARFLLDFGTIRSVMPVAELANFDANAFRALLFATLAVPVLVVLGGRGWSASAHVEPVVPARRDQHIIPLHQRVRS